jgi:hypothetical protein
VANGLRRAAYVVGHRRGRVPRSSETAAAKLDFAGREPVDAETRRPYGRSPGLRVATETNLLPRKGARDPVPGFFSGLVELRHFAGTRGRPLLLVAAGSQHLGG